MAAKNSLLHMKHHYVLVHGAWHGAWCWERLIVAMASLGLKATAPSLAGLGDRAAELDWSISLSTHVDDVIRHIEAREQGKVVLVGHSYAGVVISGVAERRPDLVAQLVYLDALLIADGESIASRWLGPEGHARFLADRAIPEHCGNPVLPARDFDIHDPKDIAWVEARLTPHPKGTYLETLHMQGAIGNGLLKDFIFCTRAKNRMIEGMRPWLESDPRAWRLHDLVAGHDAMVTAPHALARMLGDLIMDEEVEGA